MTSKKIKILIAEDDEACRKVMYRFLLPLGECQTCPDGRQAVQAVEEAVASNAHFDLICLDIHMPFMDGHAAAARIREIESKQGVRAKIMVVTALGDTVNVTNAFDAACDAYLVKPFTHAKLMEQLFFLGLIENPEQFSIKHS